MPRQCSICVHKKRRAIDDAIIAGEALRRIASRYGVSDASLRRHRDRHISELMAAAAVEAQVEDVAYGGTLTEAVERLRAQADEIRTKALEDEDLPTALRAIATMGRLIELQARLLQQIQDAPTVNILIQPEWIQVQAVLTQALEPYKDAAEAVALALESMRGEVGVRA